MITSVFRIVSPVTLTSIRKVEWCIDVCRTLDQYISEFSLNLRSVDQMEHNSI